MRKQVIPGRMSMLLSANRGGTIRFGDSPRHEGYSLASVPRLNSIDGMGGDLSAFLDAIGDRPFRMILKVID